MFPPPPSLYLSLFPLTPSPLSFLCSYVEVRRYLVGAESFNPGGPVIKLK